MRRAVEMGSVVMLRILCLMKIGSDIKKISAGYTDTQHGHSISLLRFF
jgi:hypothetical protein